jgi:hypothetical protein
MPCRHDTKLEISVLNKSIYLALEKFFLLLKNHFEFSIFPFAYIIKNCFQTHKNKISKISSNEFSLLPKNLNFYLKLKQFINFFQFRNHLKLNFLGYFISSKFIILNLLHTLRVLPLFLKPSKNFFSNLFNKKHYFQCLQIDFALMPRKLGKAIALCVSCFINRGYGAVG